MDLPVPSSDEVMCQKHGQKYHYFCNTCQELACLECVNIDHPSQSHTYTNLEMAAVEGKKSTQALLTRLEKKLPELEESLGVFKQLHPILKNHSKQAIAKVQAFAAKIRKEVTKEENHLVEEIRRENHQQTKDLNLTCEILSESITHAQFTLETGSVFTKRSTDSEFLQRRAIVEKDLYRLVDKQLPSVPKALRFLEHAGCVTLGELKEVDVERFIRKSIQETTSSSEYFSPRRPSQQKPKQKDNPLKDTANAGDIFAKFRPKPGDWKCDTCLLNNKADAMSCIACMTPKPKTSSPSFPSKPLSQNTGNGVSVNLSSGGGFSFKTSFLGSGKMSGFQPVFGSQSPSAGFSFGPKPEAAGSSATANVASTEKASTPVSQSTGQFTFGASNQKFDLGGSRDKCSKPVFGSQFPSAGFSFGPKAEAAGSSGTVASTEKAPTLVSQPTGQFTFGASDQKFDLGGSGDKCSKPVFGSQFPSAGFSFGAKAEAAGSSATPNVASTEKAPTLVSQPTSTFTFGASYQKFDLGGSGDKASQPVYGSQLPSAGFSFGAKAEAAGSSATPNVASTEKASTLVSQPTSTFMFGASYQKFDLGGSEDKASQPVFGSQFPSAGFSFGANAKAADSSAATKVASTQAQQVLSVKPPGGYAFGASTSTSSTQPSNEKPQNFCFVDTPKSKGSTFSFHLDDGKTTVASPEKTKLPGFVKSPGLNKSIDNAKTPPTNTIHVSSSKSIAGSSTLLTSMLVHKDVNSTGTPSAKPGSIIACTPKLSSSTKSFTTTPTAVAKPTTQKANKKQQGLLTTLQFSNAEGIFGSASLTQSVAPFQAAKGSDKTPSPTAATISALSFKACQVASGNTRQKPSQASAATTSTSQALFAGVIFREFKSFKKMTATSGGKGSNEVPKTSDKTANATTATFSASPTSATISASSVVSNFSGNTQQKPSHASAAATSASQSPFAGFNFGQIKPLNTMASTFGDFASKGSNELPKTSDKTTNPTAATISASSALSNVSFNANQLAAFGNTRQKPLPTPQASSETTTACQSPLTGFKFGSPTLGFVARGTPGRLDTNECHDSDNDDDVIFVSEKQPTSDQRARAEALMLPPTYFLYEDEPPCPGCVGCDPEDLAARGITLSKHSPSPKVCAGKKKGSTFGSLVPETPSLLSTKESRQPIFGTSTISFASHSSDKQGTFAQGGQKGFSFPKAGALVFDNNNNKGSTAEGQEYDPHFDPIVELPELVDVKTGEEDEEVMYKQRARLYRFANDLNVWKERGIGDVKLLRHRDTGLVRLIMRREQVLKLCANHRISTDLMLNSMESSDRTWVWYATDYAEGKPCHEQFAMKFKTPELAYEFKQRLEELQAARREEEMMASSSPEKADEAYIPKAAETKKTDATAREGESTFFVFGASPSTSPTTQPDNEKPESLTFSFRLDVSKTTEASPEKTPKPKSPGFMKSPRLNKSDDNEYYKGDEENHIYFEPVVELPECIVVKTGEEDEISRFRHRANLFRFDKKTSQWKERGTGDIKLLYNPSKRKYRIVMRRELVLKICANHYVTPELKLEPNAGSTKSWVWMAMDSSENRVQVEQFAVRFKTEEAARQFKDAIDAAQEDMKLVKETKEDDSVDFKERQEEGQGDTTAGLAIGDDVAKGNSDQDDDIHADEEDIDEEVVEEEQDTVEEQNLVFTKAQQNDNIKIQPDRGDVHVPDMPEEQDKTASERPVEEEGCDQNEDDDDDDYEDAVDGQDEEEREGNDQDYDEEEAVEEERGQTRAGIKS